MIDRTVRVLTVASLAIGASLAPRAQLAAQPAGATAAPEFSAADYRARADRIIDAALSDSSAYRRLTYLVDTFGPRPSGSESLERAIDWILQEMESDGLERVRGEPVMVPRWVRGSESLELLAPRRRRLPMLGLGGSIGTPSAGIEAEVLVVGSFDELDSRAEEAEGRIVVFDVPFTTYGETVRYRVNGAVAAARAGAVASLVRSVTPFSMQTPHTGSMEYDPQIRAIPHAAITVEDAAMLHRMQDRGDRIEVRLRMDATTFPDVPSRNVVAEIVGSEIPEEIVVVGAHIDSWDTGQGAIDDAGGSVAAWEAVRLLLELGLRPRRTVRLVLWTDEENSLAGARGYRARHREELDDHVLAIETDGGVFTPTGYGVAAHLPERTYRILLEMATLLDGIGAGGLEEGAGGADIAPLMASGVPGMDLHVAAPRYFWYHHTDADTVDKLDPRDMNLCVATLAVMAYVVADMPSRLPRSSSAPNTR